MKIALVSETYPPEVNGVAHTVQAWVEALRHLGHRVDLVRPASKGLRPQDGEGELTVRGLPLPRYPNLQFGLPAPYRLWRRWRRRRPDQVHLVTEGLLGLSALLAAKALHLPVTSSFHTHFPQYLNHYRLGWLSQVAQTYLRAFHNATALTFVPTEALRTQLANEGYRHLAVVGRGVDTRRFHPSKRDPKLRAQWGAGPETLVALWVSRLAPEKNFPLFAAAMAAMRQARADLIAVVVGSGPLATKARAQHPDLLFVGEQKGEALAAHYASADLFLFPSLTETYGVVLLEALASGLAVIAFDEAAARELIHTGENGLAVPSSDAAAFCEAARWLASHPEERERMARAAPGSVAKQSWESVVAQLLNHWQRVAQQPQLVGDAR